MIKPGYFQTLEIDHMSSHGAYLFDFTEDGDKKETVLLPKNQVEENLKAGDRLDVFVYFDSEDRLVATVNKPAITMGKVARLKVLEVNKIGAFLDWGLEKDLFLPYAEQTRKVAKDDEVLAALYADKSGRLCATMNVYPYLSERSPYHAGQTVEGEIYAVLPNFGAYVAVDDMYSAMIPKEDMQKDHEVGKRVSAKIAMVLPDGKLRLMVREYAYKAMDTDAVDIYDKIKEEYEGVLPFDDKASPERIKEVFGLSKAAFKRAVGKLYKEEKISIEEGRIEII